LPRDIGRRQNRPILVCRDDAQPDRLPGSWCGFRRGQNDAIAQRVPGKFAIFPRIGSDGCISKPARIDSRYTSDTVETRAGDPSGEFSCPKRDVSAFRHFVVIEPRDTDHHVGIKPAPAGMPSGEATDRGVVADCVSALSRGDVNTYKDLSGPGSPHHTRGIGLAGSYGSAPTSSTPGSAMSDSSAGIRHCPAQSHVLPFGVPPFDVRLSWPT